MQTNLPEYWLRGPVPEVPALLQPAAHALLQAKEEVLLTMRDFPVSMLWVKPAGMASAGFHLQHLAGVLDRLFTYALGSPLSVQQRDALKNEGAGPENDEALQTLIGSFIEQVDRSIEILKTIDENRLTETRFVGKAKIPSTLIGLLFHAAEHTMRHVGQLLVTAEVVKKAAAGAGK